MSGKWDGFTEEDIKKLNVKGSKSIKKSAVRVAKLGSAQSNNRQTRLKNNERRRVVDETLSDVSTVTIQNMNVTDQLVGLVDPVVTNPLSDAHTGATDSSTSQEPEWQANSNGIFESLEACQHDIGAVLTSTCGNSPNHIPVCIRVKEDRSYEVVGAQKMSLEEFQVKQKLMEEQNRQRKELLGRALADRKKQTTAESQRLQQIQEELQKLDSLLSNDVSILRNQIEVASLEFSEAQKRYSKAEKEFLDAKIIMFGKLEQKEMLTEHLCTIIEQNELRKARKLSELMHKLELGILPERHKEDTGNSSPPTVCFVNDISDLPPKVSDSASNCGTQEHSEDPLPSPDPKDI